VIVGAPGYDNGEAGEGAAFIFLALSTTPTPTPVPSSVNRDWRLYD